MHKAWCYLDESLNKNYSYNFVKNSYNRENYSYNSVWVTYDCGGKRLTKHKKTGQIYIIYCLLGSSFPKKCYLCKVGFFNRPPLHMRKLLFQTILLIAICTITQVQAQPENKTLQRNGLAVNHALSQPLPEVEFRTAPQLSASNCLAYPGPSGSLTPPPAGMKPFYLSHYGRHGSRYLTKIKDYDYALEVLSQGAKAGKLTPLGESVLARVKRMQAEATDRWGDLTPLGGQQHRDITRRMVDNYPEIFTERAHVDAHSTLIPRCVLSMAHAVRQLTLMKPDLNLTFDATHYDMYYLNLQDKSLIKEAVASKARQTYDEYCRSHQCWQRMVGSLFNDTAYVRQQVDGEQLNHYLFRLAGSLQNTRLASEFTLYDIFTTEELLANWRMENVYWYLGYSFSPVNGGRQPYTQRNLLRKIIEQADSCIGLPYPNAHLRYGHETMVMPLVCLMGLNGYDAVIDNLDELEQRGWVNYRVFCMGCNVQLVFYRRHPGDRDVMVKVLLNENEARLPIQSKTAPYYRWSEVREFYLHRIDSYQEVKEKKIVPTHSNK